MQMNSDMTDYRTSDYTSDCLKLIDLVNYLFNSFPTIAFRVLDLEVVLFRFAFTVELLQNANEFSESERGNDYTSSIQISPLSRSEGTIDLLKLAHPDRKLSFSSEYVIADFLAGDGYIEQVASNLLPAHQKPFFINSDISFYMVQHSQRKNLFTVLQPAQDAYWLRHNSIDAVIYAYGTHHIPKHHRLQAVKEGSRVLKQGGRFVLHDFEEGDSMSNWFQEVVNPYGKTRHDYPHFTKEEMLELARVAELRDVEVEHIPDPFVTQASTEIGALGLLAEYVIQMYGLVGLRGQIHKTLDLLDSFFNGIQVCQIATGRYEARILRNALVVHATK